MWSSHRYGTGWPWLGSSQPPFHHVPSNMRNAAPSAQLASSRFSASSRYCFDPRQMRAPNGQRRHGPRLATALERIDDCIRSRLGLVHLDLVEPGQAAVARGDQHPDPPGCPPP